MPNVSIQNKKTVRGFTLIEVMVAVSIFAVVTTVGIGALLTTNTALRSTQAQRASVDTLSFVLESMTRQVRTGRNFDQTAGVFSRLSFTNVANEDIEYRLNNQGEIIQKTIDESGDVEEYTMTMSDEVDIERLVFRIIDNGAPAVFMGIQGSVTIGSETSDLNLETLVSVR